MNDHFRCRLCQGSGSILFQTGARHAPDIEVRSCAGCGLVSLWPLPSEEELGRYYAEFYREDYGDPPLEERYHADACEAHIRVRRLQALFVPESRLLEIGSGSGAFMEAVRAHVDEVLGVEPDAKSRKWIEEKMGLPVMERVTDVLDEGKTFDLVVLFHVLEHVPDPLRFLLTIRRLLRPGGRIIAEVPNVDDMLVAIYKMPAYLRFYYQKAHLYYFSKDTLNMILVRAGFEPVVEGIQRYDLSNHMRWMLTGQPGGQGYYGGLLSPEVNAVYAESLIRSGHSDTLWAAARLREEQ